MFYVFTTVFFFFLKKKKDAYMCFSLNHETNNKTFIKDLMT
jgi:hypothetical protein